MNHNHETEVEMKVEEVEPRPEWRAPQITRIDIKRTLFMAGSAIDGESGSIFG